MSQDPQLEKLTKRQLRVIDLTDKSDAVCRMGSMMLQAGTGSYRVKAAMGRVAGALGIEELEAQVSLNEIVATTRAQGTFRTQVVEVPVPAVNADRIAALLRVSLRAEPGLTPEELHAQLDRLERKSQHYAKWAIVVGAIAACAAFAFLNNGSWEDCVIAGVAAGFGKFLQLTLRKFRLNQLAVVAFASLGACLVYVGASEVLQTLVPAANGPLHEAGFTSSILFLIPGFPLITAALDLARFDFSSGVSRLIYATLITGSAAVGAGLVAWGFHLMPQPNAPLGLSLSALLFFRIIASLVGVFGFAITFNTPMRAALAASLIGTLANVPRLEAVTFGLNPLLAAGLASLAIGLMAGWASQKLPAPRIILSVPAVLIMIPGADTYRAMIAAIHRDPLSALTYGTAAIGIVIALAGGLAFARMLTDPAWISNDPQWTRMPETQAQRILREKAHWKAAANNVQKQKGKKV